MTKDIRLIFGKNVKKLRKELGLTQEQLSESFNIDYKYLQRIEGKTMPLDVRISTVARFAKALKTTPPEMLK